jgi:hypothetical protein
VINLDLKVVGIEPLDGINVIVGQSHFIKTVEDIYEAIVNTVPQAKFGIAFCEASIQRLVRHAGNDPELEKIAAEKALEIGAGHSFIIYLKEAFPINILGRIKDVPEVCTIFCASADPIQLIIAKTEQGRGIVGVIDGFDPIGIEKEDDIESRKKLLRMLGYKF